MIERAQPVAPVPVATMRPLEEWSSAVSPSASRYLADWWLRWPTNSSLSATSFSPVSSLPSTIVRWSTATSSWRLAGTAAPSSSEERRVGEGCVGSCKYTGSTYHEKKHKQLDK